ncbi:MAG: helix-turn-helix domain-containing protein [Protaetiibacter sp.]
MTIADAAATLHVSEPRVYQLLNQGVLKSAELPAGRSRFAGGSARVLRSSVVALLASREKAAQSYAPATTAEPSRDSRNDSTDRMHEFKVQTDILREELRSERAKTKKLIDVAATLIELVRLESATGDRVDEVASTYSNLLTQALTPDDASKLNDRND